MPKGADAKRRGDLCHNSVIHPIFGIMVYWHYGILVVYFSLLDYKLLMIGLMAVDYENIQY